MTTCEDCGQPFTATRATATFSSTACRQRAHRDRVAAEDQPSGDGPLVAAVRGEWAAMGQLENANGQLAVQLAKGIERRPSPACPRSCAGCWGTRGSKPHSDGAEKD